MRRRHKVKVAEAKRILAKRQRAFNKKMKKLTNQRKAAEAAATN
jgi:hypothetical protein